MCYSDICTYCLYSIQISSQLTKIMTLQQNIVYLVLSSQQKNYIKKVFYQWFSNCFLSTGIYSSVNGKFGQFVLFFIVDNKSSNYPENINNDFIFSIRQMPTQGIEGKVNES